MSLVIVGEVASTLISTAPDFVAAHPEIPWRSMRGMRNRVIHGYFQTDLALVWGTVQTALPELLHQLESMLRSSSQQDEDGDA
jgi:uncharacterized protein with HEPN domain